MTATTNGGSLACHRYTTDATGRRTSRTLPGGQTEIMTWQNALQLAFRTDFNGCTTVFIYDAEGNLLDKTADPTDPSLALPHAPAKVRYTYNSFDLPATAETLTAGGSVLTTQSWSCDAYGRLMAVTAPGGTLTCTRDAQDRITGVSSNHADGADLTYGYNTAGQIASVTDHRPATPRTHQFTWTPSGALGRTIATERFIVPAALLEAGIPNTGLISYFTSIIS